MSSTRKLLILFRNLKDGDYESSKQGHQFSAKLGFLGGVLLKAMEKTKDMTKSYEPSKSYAKSLAKIESMQRKFPPLPWLDNPDLWDAKKYYDETAQEIIDVHGALSNHDQAVLTLLTAQMDSVNHCSKLLAEQGHIYTYNAGKTMGPSPAFQMRVKALEIAVRLMNELGITLKSRGNNKPKDNDDIGLLLKGPKA